MRAREQEAGHDRRHRDEDGDPRPGVVQAGHGGAGAAICADLDAVVSTLQGEPGILEVEVQSHTDERGDDDVNLKLSEQRAQIVMKYLVEKGVAASRLTAQGYGETQPIDRAQTPAAWAKNERIVFLILKRSD